MNEELFMYLLPGLTVAKLVSLVIAKKQNTLSEMLVEGGIFSFIIYWLIKISPLSSILTTIISIIVLVLVVTLIVNKGVYYWIMEKIKLSIKCAEMPFYKTMKQRKYIIAHLKNGYSVYGFPSTFTDVEDSEQVYLVNCSWVDENRKYTDMINNEGVLLKHSEIEFIEVLKE